MKKKILVFSLAAVLLVVAAVGGTLAYLTSTAQVKNTFTVGKVVLTLDEAKTDEYGAVDDTVAARVEANEYKLIPGHSYTKDPIIHFAPGSESSYLFVKVENGIFDLESKAEGYMSIAAQLAANGWTLLTDQTNVYCKTDAVDANTGSTAVDYNVFDTFTIDGEADLSDYINANADLPKLDVTAYAVQADGFATATAAWAATYGKQLETNNH